MHFTALTLSTLFLSALAAPTGTLETTDFDYVDDLISKLEDATPSLPEEKRQDLSELDLSSADGVISELESGSPSLPEKRQDLSDVGLSSVDDVLNEVGAPSTSLPETESIPETDSVLEERQAEPLVDLVDDLLRIISPFAGEIEDLISSLASSDTITEPTDIAVEIEGLLTQIVIEVVGAVSNITSIATGDHDGLLGVLKEVFELVNDVIAEVEGKVDLDAVDQIIVSLNDELSQLIEALGGVVGL